MENFILRLGGRPDLPDFFRKNFCHGIDPLFRPPLKHYIKGGYGRGEGVYHYYHPCQTILLPEGEPPSY